MKVPFFDLKEQYSNVKSEVLKEIEDILETCSFVGGSYVNKFEKEFSEYLGVKHTVSCSNGTDALVLALRACGVGYGDEVITSPFSFFATAEAIASIGAEPVFADIDLDDFTIDPDEIEKWITPSTKAIVAVHIFGACCDMDRIMSIAKKHGIKVIEDAAQAVGSKYKGRKAGTLGDIGCFSFYPTKNLGGAGDGGACTTNDDTLATNLKALKDHGSGQCGADARKNLLEEDADVVDSKYANYLIGYNSRLDAFQACVLSIKLKHLDEYNGKRKAIADLYSDYLTCDVDLPYVPSWSEPCWHQYVIMTEYKNELCKYLNEHEVGCNVFYPIPLHKQPAFDTGVSLSLPNAEEAARKTVCLPIYPEMTDEQVKYAIDTVNRFFGVTNCFVHETAEVSEDAEIGDGTKIWNDCQVRENATIGEGCNIGKNVYVDFDVVIGNRVKIQNNASLFHGVTLEDDVFVGPSVTFTNDMYPRAVTKGWKVSETKVMKGASIGANSTIRCGVKIGEYAMIGCGSVVTKDVEPYSLVVGNPARKIGQVNKEGEVVLRYD